MPPPSRPATTAPASTTTNGAPTTSSPATTLADSAGQVRAPAPGCTRLEDFDADLASWFVVNDGVMGGRSDGRAEIGDSLLAFSGTVVTAGGGFTSVRLRLDGGELDGSDRVVLRVRSDDRGYGLTYEDDEGVEGRRVSHRAELTIGGSTDDDGFRLVELPHDALRPSM